MTPLALVRARGIGTLGLAGAIVAAALLLRSAPPPAVPVPVPVSTPFLVELPCQDPDVVDAPSVPAFDPAAPAAPGAADRIQEAIGALSYGHASAELLPVAVDAVVAAPGSPKARYVLACALNRGGAPDAARAQLEPLTRGCPGCADALANLATDLTCDWRDDERGLAPPPSPVRRAALAIHDAARSGELAVAAAHLRGEVDVTSTCSVCDPGDEVRHARSTADAVVRGLVRSADPDADTFIHFGQRLWCDDRCCTEDIGYLSHSSSFVTALCFDPATRALRSIDFVDG